MLDTRLRGLLERGHTEEMRVMGEDMRDPRIEEGRLHAPAAVLIAITDRPEPGLILTRRASHLRNHAGQVALPGGRVDPGDADAIAAALREAEEEIALPRELVRVVGTSDPYKTFTGFDIMPVVGVIPPDLSLAPHEQEVESVFELPLDFAMHPRNRARKTMEFQGTVRPYYEINWQDYRIWGVTAAILVNLSRRLGYSADDV